MRHPKLALVIIVCFCIPIISLGQQSCSSLFESILLNSLLERAENGEAEAQCILGEMYQYGNGVPRDYTEAMKWYRMAAQQGHAQAQAKVGVMYFNGNGVPQDYAEAMKWWRLAAEQGNATALINLANMYEMGKGVPRDYVQAHMWFTLMANVGKGDSRELAERNRERIAQKMTPEQIAEAERLAIEWMVRNIWFHENIRDKIPANKTNNLI